MGLNESGIISGNSETMYLYHHEIPSLVPVTQTPPTSSNSKWSFPIPKNHRLSNQNHDSWIPGHLRPHHLITSDFSETSRVTCIIDTLPLTPRVVYQASPPLTLGDPSRPHSYHRSDLVEDILFELPTIMRTNTGRRHNLIIHDITHGTMFPSNLLDEYIEFEFSPSAEKGSTVIWPCLEGISLVAGAVLIASSKEPENYALIVFD